MPGVRAYGPYPYARLEWKDGAARFVLEGLHEGEHSLRLDWESAWFPSEPEKLRVDVPGGPIEVLVRDDLPEEEVLVRVIDPRAPGRVELVVSERAVRVYERFEPQDAVRIPDGRRAIELASGPVAADTEVAAIHLSMEGHESVWLTDDDVPSADEHGRRTVELVPRPGWSARVEVATGRETQPTPAPGIVLAFDGVEAPASDEHGWLVHRADTEPRVLSVATPGWELVDRASYFGRGSVFAASGRFTLEDGELTVLVRRTDR